MTLRLQEENASLNPPCPRGFGLEVRGKSGNELERGRAAVVANPRIDFKSPSRLLERTFHSALPNPLPLKQIGRLGRKLDVYGAIELAGSRRGYR